MLHQGDRSIVRHAGIEDGLNVSPLDARRMDLLLQDPSTQQDELTAGITVSIFKATYIGYIPRVTLRVVDADMFQGSH